MSRYLFGGTSSTTTTIPRENTSRSTPYSTFNINRYSNLTIEDLNTAIIDNDEETVMGILNANNISINQTITRDPYRNTVLHTAIIMGNVKIIQKLIDMGADLRLKNKKGENCADLLSKSHLGSIIEYIADKDSVKVEELKKDVKEKNTKIKNLEENVKQLEKTNNKIYEEKQKVEIEVKELRKRKVELEETNTRLIQATKKQKN